MRIYTVATYMYGLCTYYMYISVTVVCIYVCTGITYTQVYIIRVHNTQLLCAYYIYIYIGGVDTSEFIVERVDLSRLVGGGVK